MSDAKILPIEQAPTTPLKLSDADLHTLNEALLTAQLRQSQAGELAARAELAQVSSRRAAEVFISLRLDVSRRIGVQIGETHGWDQQTGEVRPIRR